VRLPTRAKATDGPAEAGLYLKDGAFVGDNPQHAPHKVSMRWQVGEELANGAQDLLVRVEGLIDQDGDLGMDLPAAERFRAALLADGR